jgi:hypothetical protein
VEWTPLTERQLAFSVFQFEKWPQKTYIFRWLSSSAFRYSFVAKSGSLPFSVTSLLFEI